MSIALVRLSVRPCVGLSVGGSHIVLPRHFIGRLVRWDGTRCFGGLGALTKPSFPLLNTKFGTKYPRPLDGPGSSKKKDPDEGSEQ